jgi:hypothetical protein
MNKNLLIGIALFFIFLFGCTEQQTGIVPPSLPDGDVPPVIPGGEYNYNSTLPEIYQNGDELPPSLP